MKLFHDKQLKRANGLLKACTAFSNEATPGSQLLFLKSVGSDILRANPDFLEMAPELNRSQLERIIRADMASLTRGVRLCSPAVIESVVNSTVFSILEGIGSWMADSSILEDVDNVESFLSSLGVMAGRQLHEYLLTSEEDPAAKEVCIKDLSTVWLSTRIAFAVSNSERRGEMGKLEADAAQKLRTDVQMQSELQKFLERQSEALVQAKASDSAQLAVYRFMHEVNGPKSAVLGGMIESATSSAKIYKDPNMKTFFEMNKQDSDKLFGNIMHGLLDEDSSWSKFVEDLLTHVASCAVGATAGATAMVFVAWKLWSIRSRASDVEAPPGSKPPCFSEAPPNSEKQPLYFKKMGTGRTQWVRKVDPSWFRRVIGTRQENWSKARQPFVRVVSGEFTAWTGGAGHPPRKDE